MLERKWDLGGEREKGDGFLAYRGKGGVGGEKKKDEDK